LRRTNTATKPNDEGQASQTEEDSYQSHML
jgi:hypothetical protein